MTQTVAQFAVRCAQAPVIMRATAHRMVGAAALSVTTAVRAEIAAATRGTNRLSGVGVRGAKVGVGFDVKGDVKPTAIVYARGPLHLIERPTKPHVIVPKRRRRQTRSGRGNIGGFSVDQERLAAGSTAVRKRGRALSTPAGPRARVDHPGTSGKYPFARGVNRAVPRLAGVTKPILHEGIRKVVFR